MHFLSLVTLEIPEVQEDKETDRQVAETLDKMRIQKESTEKNIYLDIMIERFRGLHSSFSRTVDNCVSDLLYPYCESIEDPAYLEFYDRTDKLHEEYEGTTDCIKLAQGTIVGAYSYPYYSRFTIRDGKVFQKDAGPLHHEKRTKKAKRMKALPDYPRKKLYRDFNDYAENGCGCVFDEKHQAYGYFYNPNAMWDWYSIGGRWPKMFLVQDTCREYSLGERSWGNSEENLEAPEGYLWVCAARKKDIAWTEMRNWCNKKAAERFEKMERMFLSGQTDSDFPGKIVEDGILYWGEYVYHKGDTLQTYLNEYGIPEDCVYPVFPHDIVDGKAWQSKDDSDFHTESGKFLENDWRSHIDEYVEALEVDAVLVGVDYHI